MTLETDSLSVTAMGGTELQKYGLIKRIEDPDIESKVQIFVSRVERPLDPNKIRLFYAHDLPEDPASQFLHSGGWQKFDALVFVSNWQMQNYINTYGIDWGRCVVMQNSIETIEMHDKPRGKLKLAYWSTPHRGLNILIPVFEKLSEEYDIELDVYSSFKLYGWPERDEPFKDLFERCIKHPKINYKGTVSNDEIREALLTTHIMAYPNIWPETSCICLMEAMAAGLACVHPNYGALSETAANWTEMYQWTPDLNQHATIFYHKLRGVIENYWHPLNQTRLKSSAAYANTFYNWEFRAPQWNSLLGSLVSRGPTPL